MNSRTAKANKKLIACIGSVLVMAVCFISFGLIRSKAANLITVHFSAESQPNIYYWNTNNSGDIPLSWPGVAMESEGNNWYSYTITATASNLIFNVGNWQTGDLYRESGEWWYIDGTWTNVDPNNNTDSVKVHYYSNWGKTNIYYMGVNEKDDHEEAMTQETEHWYTYEIKNSAANLYFYNEDETKQTKNLYRSKGEWWFMNNTWYNECPEEEDPINPPAPSATVPATVEPTPTVDPTTPPTVIPGNYIKVHYYTTSGGANIYYWKADNSEYTTTWPGVAMTSEGKNWYGFSFENTTFTNLIFNYNGNQTADLSQTSGEWWYYNNQWYDKEPDPNVTPAPTATPGPVQTYSPVPHVDSDDFRDETIYFVMTTRFYDGDSSNNIHCWDDKKAGNPDSDPAWRGDFKGLIEKLDYIKSLGFTAVWITPVVQNASGYDYHGYHALNFSKVDPRYLSDDTTYQDLIDAVHARGMKIIQDVVFNHTGNFGEVNLLPIFDKAEDVSLDTTPDNMVKITDKLPEDYDDMEPYPQFQARLNLMKEDNTDTEFIYHHEKNLGWEDYNVQTAQIDGDCVDLDTENPDVAKYLIDCYTKYINMGVDGFRIDTLKHISRLTMNNYYVPAFLEAGVNNNKNFFMFGEVCSRYRQVWNSGMPCISCPFYTWKEEKAYAWGDTQTNLASVAQNWIDNKEVNNEPTSSRAFLNGNSYHEATDEELSRANGLNVIDFPMHWNFNNAYDAFNVALDGDKYYADCTYNVTYVDSHDYAPDCAPEGQRFAGSQDTWAENLNLMFTFRGIPCIYYGSEIEFQKGCRIDVGPNAPLSTTGRAYFGDYIEGDLKVTDFAEYKASGAVAETLSHPLSLHIQRLNKLRAAVPALRKGQYSTSNQSGSGMAFRRRYTNDKEGIDSFALVCISGSTTFTSIPAGNYVELITGKTVYVSGSSLTTENVGKGNMRIYVLDNGKNGAKLGKVGADGTYLK
ncbi:MAG: starch-binding protein [Lachnospiraceae bacterium]|nr:starch-binding protein [Lachnospiraceae bacterium]